MFDVECKADAPVLTLQIEAVAVRGELGPMTVWWTRGGHHGKHDHEASWELACRETATPSFRRLRPFKLDEPLNVAPGEKVSN